jgi:hypothetical protein
VYVHRGADSKSGSLKPRALQAQHGNGHRASVPPAHPIRPVIHSESPNLRALGRNLSKVATIEIFCRRERRNSLRVNHGLLLR